MFRLETVSVPVPKWGKACGWTPQDDAMLLLGIYWCARLPSALRLSLFSLGPTHHLYSAPLGIGMHRSGKPPSTRGSSG